MQRFCRCLWLGMALAALLAACVSSPPESATPGAPAAHAPAAPARPGGTLVVATPNDPGQLNPGLTTAFGTHLVTGNIYSGLLQFDDKLQPQPNLAERWEVSPDGKTYTFFLRRNVTWHDGKPFTSADVAFSFEQVLLKYHARTKAGLEKVLEAIDSPDAATVVFRFKAPYAPLLRRLDVVEAPILARHVYEGADVQRSEANLKPVGTGPYKFAEYVKGDRVRLVRNASYFKPGLPLLDEVVFRIVPQSTTALLALERGEVDYTTGVPGPEIARLARSTELKLVKAPAGPGGSFCIEQLIFNLARPPLDRLAVRQAFAHAIDRRRILEQVHFGQGRVASGPIASSMAWAYDPGVPQYAFRPAMAKELLGQAGVAQLAVTFVHAPQFQKTAEVVRENLAEVGVSVQLKTLEVNAANEQIFVKKDFDLGIGSYCNGPDPEVGVTRAYASWNIGPIPFSNGSGYRNARVDQLFAQAAATVSEPARAELYHEVQAQLVRDLPYLWLVETELFRAYRADVRDLRPWSGDLAERAWLEKR
ncbi:MAG: ABC transporter substrate-binding protein [Chloroflexi bacterium]|nr:ABC transporter substrate-binding protein [Chloroflexota bacterium]